VISEFFNFECKDNDNAGRFESEKGFYKKLLLKIKLLLSKMPYFYNKKSGVKECR
jgi:hypothetical protein